MDIKFLEWLGTKNKFVYGLILNGIFVPYWVALGFIQGFGVPILIWCGKIVVGTILILETIRLWG